MRIIWASGVLVHGTYADVSRKADQAWWASDVREWPVCMDHALGNSWERVQLSGPLGVGLVEWLVLLIWAAIGPCKKNENGPNSAGHI